MKIMPAIDLKDGKCVRLFKGDFEKSTEYSNEPLRIGKRFSALEVQDLHIVDLDGARSGTQGNRAIVRDIVAETGLEVQLGGGIRDRATIARWLAEGVSRCVVGSMAIEEADTVTEWLREFGGDAIVLALDVKLLDDGTPMLTTHGWVRDAGISLWEGIGRYASAGAKHVLCTDVSRDGAMSGPNTGLYEEFLRRHPELKLQASGGVRDINDLLRLRAAGVPAAITGRALLDGKISTAEVASFRQSA